MTKSAGIATRIRVTREEYRQSKGKAAESGQDLADWLADAVRKALTSKERKPT